jgi:hypothetical protein
MEHRTPGVEFEGTGKRAKRCVDCTHFDDSCRWLLNLTGDETACDWTPSRFQARAALVNGLAELRVLTFRITCACGTSTVLDAAAVTPGGRWFCPTCGVSWWVAYRETQGLTALTVEPWKVGA